MKKNFKEKVIVKSIVLTFDAVIDKYFREDKNLYFHSSDAHKTLEEDPYLRYDRRTCGGNRVVLWVGGCNGEIAIKVCTTPEELETLIKAIIY